MKNKQLQQKMTTLCRIAGHSSQVRAFIYPWNSYTSYKVHLFWWNLFRTSFIGIPHSFGRLLGLSVRLFRLFRGTAFSFFPWPFRVLSRRKPFILLSALLLVDAAASQVLLCHGIHIKRALQGWPCSPGQCKMSSLKYVVSFYRWHSCTRCISQCSHCVLCRCLVCFLLLFCVLAAGISSSGRERTFGYLIIVSREKTNLHSLYQNLIPHTYTWILFLAQWQLGVPALGFLKCPKVLFSENTAGMPSLTLGD